VHKVARWKKTIGYELLEARRAEGKNGGSLEAAGGGSLEAAGGA
jgi:hypothetical protein